MWQPGGAHGFAPVMVCIGVAEALYDYVAQADDELSMHEGDILYLEELIEDAWYRARTPSGDAAGLVPANYVEMRTPRSLVALYDYAPQNTDELQLTEGVHVDVFDEGDWVMARVADSFGLVPGNYVGEAATEAPEETSAAPAASPAQPDPAPPAAPPSTLVPPPMHISRQSSPQPSPQATSIPEDDDTDGTSAPMPRSVPAAWTAHTEDELQLWSVTQVDAKKKKKKAKGTLGIGNASLFFASESDGAAVPRVAIKDVLGAELDKSKYLVVELSGAADVDDDKLVFHVGSAASGTAIIDRINDSQRIFRQNSRVSPAAPADPTASASKQQHTAAASKQKSAAAAARSKQPDEEMVVVLYDFEAQGRDELTVSENDQLVLLERENDEWWKLQNAAGNVGVVPASYVEVIEPKPEPIVHGYAGSISKGTVSRGSFVRPMAEPGESRPTIERTERTSKAAKNNRMRTWIDATGKFRVEAELLGVSNDSARLHKANGAVIDVPLTKLSISDINYLESLTGQRLSKTVTPTRASRRSSVMDTPRDTRAARETPRRRPNIDWFDFFLDAGVDIRDCTRYAVNFERDHIDESIVPELESDTLRSLGLREGDIVRVRRYIHQKYYMPSRFGRRGSHTAAAAPTARALVDDTRVDEERRMREDEELARRLQAQEIAAQRRAQGPPPKRPTSPPKETKEPKEAPTAKPSAAEPPVSETKSEPMSAETIAAAVEIVRRREREEAEERKKNERPPDPNSELFDKLEKLKKASPKPEDKPFDPTAPRGPLAPVPANQGLLQPLIPLQGTGQIVPTSMNSFPQPTGMGMPTGFGMSPFGMPAQATGMYGVPQPQPPPAPQPPQPLLGTATAETTSKTNDSERFAAANVFQQMKTGSGAFANNDSTAPQSSAKYDALRTQPTGFASGGVVGTPMDASSPFSGGFMPQPTGMSVMPGMPAMTTGMPGAPGYMMPPGFYG